MAKFQEKMVGHNQRWQYLPNFNTHHFFFFFLREYVLKLFRGVQSDTKLKLHLRHWQQPNVRASTLVIVITRWWQNKFFCRLVVMTSHFHNESSVKINIISRAKLVPKELRYMLFVCLSLASHDELLKQLIQMWATIPISVATLVILPLDIKTFWPV